MPNTHPAPTVPRTNFSFLQAQDEQLLRLGMLAEKYFADDPNTCLLKLRQLAELLAQLVASQVGLYTAPEETQYDLLRRLQGESILPREIAELFGEVRRAGNAANHAGQDNHSSALATLRITWELGLWFYRTFQNPTYKSGPFIPPAPPADESETLRVELERLTKELHDYQATHQETAIRLEVMEANLLQAKDEQAFWEQMALDTEQAKTDLEKLLTARQAEITRTPAEIKQVVSRAQAAAEKLHLDESDTRKLIDEQLRQAGWEADTFALTYGKGARPEKGKNRAIAEWPTGKGPADYVLFIGLMPVATLEAKRKNVNVSASLQQAKRYNRGFLLTHEMVSPGHLWDEFPLPFTFSSNGRPFLRQLATQSGIWFCDVRRPENISRALEGWYSPEGLLAMLKRDETAAYKLLRVEPFDYGFTLREYQKQAIRAVEAGVAEGKRSLLVAMATGTGKTKTCIALIYRALKVKRFRRVLFLVDRSALGEQAANAFKETRMESLQTFADIFGIKELKEKDPDSDTTVQIATVQGMVQRILNPAEGQPRATVDEYDCIVVDECHRGYLLDRELSEGELTFRNQDDYISKYRRVLDYFDAVKIGLTATPALHTTDIFGLPVYTYSYREAVIDGFLVDHEPPIQIHTQLSKNGITWQTGEKVKTYDVAKQQIELFTTPDQIKIEVDGFNKKVITEPFNRVVCAYLAREIDPNGRQKTLIFCANDAHADLVVTLLKEEFQKQYGTVDDDAVLKITGSADKPLALIRRYKNERNPSIAVTVDLLTTGIDVPEICNIVFMRRVNSRILFDQMLGRATRLCPEVGKEAFRVFDAVQIYEAIKNITAMQPVVVDPRQSFTQLTEELTTLEDDEMRGLVRDQFLAKLQRTRLRFSERTLLDFEAVAGMLPEALIGQLKTMSAQEVGAWFTQHPGLGDLLDRRSGIDGDSVLISEHKDEVYSIERGYGEGQKPEDYLDAFAAFIRDNQDKIPALITVLTRPRDLTRKQLRELALELDRAGFTETNLATAWRETTNQDIAARIVGYIRKAAAGDSLISYDERVNQALQRILASKSWTTPQRQWLHKIAAQTRANVIVDREMLDDDDLLFKREGGGFQRLNKLFDGELTQVLDSFHDALWSLVA